MEYGTAYRDAARSASQERSIESTLIEPRFRSTLTRPFRLVLAGAAGGRVDTAARLLCRAAIMSGLFAAGRRDYPVTVKTGYSVAEVVLSPTPIEDVAVATTDALMVLAPEGRAQAMPYLSRLAPGARIFALADIESFPAEHPIERLDPAAASPRIPRDLIAFTATAAVALRLTPQCTWG